MYESNVHRFLLFAFADKYAGVFLFPIDIRISEVIFINTCRSHLPDDFELIGVMLIQVGNGYSHYSVIVTGNISGLIYVDGIVVVVVRIFLGALLLVEGEFLVSLLYVEVRKPSYPRNSDHPLFA